jgi:hypothetical protein
MATQALGKTKALRTAWYNPSATTHDPAIEPCLKETGVKKVLVIYYSQTGQLTRVTQRFTQALVEANDIEVHFENVRPVEDYPFPWPFLRFLDTFPESVYLDPPPMRASTLQGNEEFDLVILAYQVWFLSPSLPITGFLKSPVARRLLADKPVVTLIACRNMWLVAQEEMKKLLRQLDAHLVGNVALVDEAGSLGSFLATPAWVLSGDRGPHLGGLIPRAGVAEQQIAACERFGKRIVEVLDAGQAIDESLLRGLGAVAVDEKLISSEKTARRGFLVWGRLLRSLGPQGALARKPVLLVYVCFLLFFILTFVPLSMLVKKLLSPFSRKRIAEQKAYFSQPSGP